MAEKTAADYGEDENRARSESLPPLDEKEGLRTVDAGLSVDQVVADYDEHETRRIMRKIDYRLIPLLSVLYLYAPFRIKAVHALTTSTGLRISTAVILEMQRLQAWRKIST